MWYSIEDASQFAHKRTIQRRVAKNTIPSYVDQDGKRLVWIDENTSVFNELERLRQEMEELRADFKEMAGVPLLRPQGIILPARYAGILQEIRDSGFSDRHVERESGLPKSFLSKAKLGRRNGPRAYSSWAKIENFLSRRQAKTA